MKKAEIVREYTATEYYRNGELYFPSSDEKLRIELFGSDEVKKQTKNFTDVLDVVKFNNKTDLAAKIMAIYLEFKVYGVDYYELRANIIN